MRIAKLLKTQEDELLLSQVLRRPREFLIAHPETPITKAQLKRFSSLQKKLAAGMPLAYVLGYRWFFSHTFKVNRKVLIPRPETEQLVELALHEFKNSKRIPWLVVDVGTGSGAIIISVAAALESRVLKQRKGRAKSLSPQFVATDISAAALATAKHNAARILLRPEVIAFKRGDLLRPILPQLKNNPAKHNLAKPTLIIANLPYLTREEMCEPSIRYEPKSALFGGKNGGLAHITELLEQLKASKIAPCTVLLETGIAQATEIKKLAKKHWPAARVSVYKDMRGYNRICKITIGR